MPSTAKLQRILHEFDRVARRLTLIDLQRIGGKEQSWSLQDIETQLANHSGSQFLLGTYTPEGVRHALAEYGFLRKLEERGFRDIQVRFVLEDPFQQHVRIYHANTMDPEHLLAEIVLHEGIVSCGEQCPVPRHLSGPYAALILDWVMLQNPSGSFSRQRPRFPGQQHPGLGLGHETFGLFVNMARRLHKDCILTVPERFHNAWLYHPSFSFVSPRKQGIFNALKRVVSVYHPAEVSWGIEKGYLMNTASGEIFQWKPSDMIYPMREDLAAWFRSPAYTDAVAEAELAYRFVPDWVEGQFVSEMYPEEGR